MKSSISYLFLLMLFISCEKEKEKESAYTYEKAKINSNIKKEEVFNIMNYQNDLFCETESGRKKTSAAQYYFKWKSEIEIPQFYSYNCCRAWIINDTLVIRIGTATYLSDFGMKIKYKNGQYYVVPFETSDLIIEEDLKKKKTREVFFLRNRKLVLDKLNYKNGDSIYGRIHAEVEEPENTKFKKTTEHFVDGYFRTKIGEY